MCSVLLKPAHNSAQLRCFENGNDDVGVEAFWIGDAARVGYFVPLNGPLNGHPPSITNSSLIFGITGIRNVVKPSGFIKKKSGAVFLIC